MPGRSMMLTRAPSGKFGDAGVLLHRHAGEICDLLPQAGETIEQGGLAGVRRTDQGHRAGSRRLARQGQFQYGGGAATVASAAIAHGPRSLSGLLASSSSLIFSRRAVSRRSAISEPSTWNTRGIAARSAIARGDARARQKSQFHQTAGIVAWASRCRPEPRRRPGAGPPGSREALPTWSLLPLSCNIISVCAKSEIFVKRRAPWPRSCADQTSSSMSLRTAQNIKDNRMPADSPCAACGGRSGPDPGNRTRQFRRGRIRSQPVCRIPPRMRGSVSGRGAGGNLRVPDRLPAGAPGRIGLRGRGSGLPRPGRGFRPDGQRPAPPAPARGCASGPHGQNDQPRGSGVLREIRLPERAPRPALLRGRRRRLADGERSLSAQRRYFTVIGTEAMYLSHSSCSLPFPPPASERAILKVSMGAGGLLMVIGTRPRSCAWL